PFPSLMPVKSISVFGGASVNTLQIMIVVTSIVLMFILDRWVNTTRMGRAMRATSMDQDAAGLMGIDNNRIISIVFFVGPALGAIAGIFHGMYYGSVKFDMGFTPGIKSFTAAVLGGIGNIRGAMLGGFLLGILES